MRAVVLAATVCCAAMCGAKDYPIQAVGLRDAKVTGGFWLSRVNTNREITLWADFARCEETGRIANFENAGKRAIGTFKGIPFDDSDVFKVVEGASYILATNPDPKLDTYLDGLIAKIASAQEEDGYLYTARTLGHNTGSTGSPKWIGSNRWETTYVNHELYNLGHLYEAAVAHYEATGKRTLLDVALKSAELIDRTFGFEEGKLKKVPGHEEIEIGLCKLYRVTKDARWLKLAKTFIMLRGRKNLRADAGSSDRQDHLPVTEQKEAVGHAVRAGYLYSGMADVAVLDGDEDLRRAVDALWENVVGRKLHLSGGIGARRNVKHPVWGAAHEAFSEDYDLPNEEAYLETCAAIANALWNQRMFLRSGDSKYVDVLERIIYNGFLSGISLTGDEFFYPNPLASKGGYKRSKWFGCSCCPVNIVRFIPQIITFAYAGDGEDIFWNLFIESEAKLKLKTGEVSLKQKTEYPWEGRAVLEVDPSRDNLKFTLKVRVPGWALGRPVPSDLYTYADSVKLDQVMVRVNGKDIPLVLEKGYVKIDRAWKQGDKVEIKMDMPVRRVKAHPSVAADANRLAVERGPVLYCAEGSDNSGRAFDAVIAADAAIGLSTCNILGNIYPSLLVAEATGRDGLKLIPYFAWCHRGENEMQVWFPVKPLADSK